MATHTTRATDQRCRRPVRAAGPRHQRAWWHTPAHRWFDVPLLSGGKSGLAVASSTPTRSSAGRCAAELTAGVRRRDAGVPGDVAKDHCRQRLSRGMPGAGGRGRGTRDDDDAPLLVYRGRRVRRWTAILADSLRARRGRGHRAADGDAWVASIEGTVAICRAERSTTALDDIDAILTPLCAAGRWYV